MTTTERPRPQPAHPQQEGPSAVRATFTNITFETTRLITADLTIPEPMRFQTAGETLAVETIIVTFRPPGCQLTRWSASGTRSSDATPARIDFEPGQEEQCPPRLLALVAELTEADEPDRAAGHLHSRRQTPDQTTGNSPGPS